MKEIMIFSVLELKTKQLLIMMMMIFSVLELKTKQLLLIMMMMMIIIILFVRLMHYTQQINYCSRLESNVF
jgi:hypothetical protein